jgi:hypothetical protein
MKMRLISAAVLAIAAVFCISSAAFAAGTTTASVPVTLTVANEYRAVNVSVPATLPVYVINGDVLTANDTRIVNNATSGAVKVTAVAVTDGAYEVGSFEAFSGAGSIALEINNCPTTGEGKLSIAGSAFPEIAAGGSIPLQYSAKVSADAPNAKDVNAANVVFTIAVV